MKRLLLPLLAALALPSQVIAYEPCIDESTGMEYLAEYCFTEEVYLNGYSHGKRSCDY